MRTKLFYNRLSEMYFGTIRSYVWVHTVQEAGEHKTGKQYKE